MPETFLKSKTAHKQHANTQYGHKIPDRIKYLRQCSLDENCHSSQVLPFCFSTTTILNKSTKHLFADKPLVI